MAATQTQTPAVPAAPAAASGGKPATYLVEVQKEMRKVNWPKRSELVANTILTLVASFILSLVFFFSDTAISRLLSLIYG